MKRKTLSSEMVIALNKILRDEKLSEKEKLLIIKFLATNEAGGVTTDDVFNLVTLLYNLYDLFKDYLE